MSHYNTIFHQLFNFIPEHRFEKMVNELKMNHYCKGFTAWKQALTVLYAQITGKDSLREIESGLLSSRNKVYHLGMDTVARSTLSDAMNRRDSRIFEEMFSEAAARAQALAPRHKFRFHNPLYSLDSTTISLCLSMFDWATYRQRKGAVKIHTQLNHSGHLPAFLVISDGKTSDIKAARTHMTIDPDSIYCMDKGFYDLNWFRHIDEQKAFFVTRLKDNADIIIAGQHREPNRRHGVMEDKVIEFCNPQTFNKYPKQLRAVEYCDRETGKIYVFITNNFKLSAATIAEIYHQRWQIEIFFKWIKQNLKIKSFFGTSENAVMTQIYLAMVHYLVLSYIRFMSRTEFSLTEVARRIKEGLMERLNLMELLAISRKNVSHPPEWNSDASQPDLFGFNF